MATDILTHNIYFQYDPNITETVLDVADTMRQNGRYMTDIAYANTKILRPIRIPRLQTMGASYTRVH